MKLILLLSLIAVGITATTLVAKKELKLKEGDAAPSFTACDETGKSVKFPEDFKGKLVALVFYPMANTPGCTKEMCNLSKDDADLKKSGVTVIGISPSKEKNQAKFKDSHALPFTLLTASDEICKAYNVEGFLWIDRHTFLIKDGKIVKRITHVDKKKPGQQILEGFGLAKK